MTRPKVGFVSLGCSTLVDSERILTQLRIDGYEITQNYEEAAVVVVNTCGFIDSIRAESLEAIGFPGETEAEFQELLEFLEADQLDRVGCFKYSPVKGAQANAFANAVAEEIKQERWERFMQTQNIISREKLRKKIGRTLTVLVDETGGDGIIGRGYADVPEIDGNVFIKSEEILSSGELVKVKIDRAGDDDLWGTYIGK